jgi:hypothetical protein
MTAILDESRRIEFETLGFRCFANLAVSPAKTFNASCSVHQALFAGVKGMTLRTQIEMQRWGSGASFKRIPARAHNHAFLVVRMDAFFHSEPPLVSITISLSASQPEGRLP